MTGLNVQSAPFFALPAGVIVPYAGSASPAGWLLCQGQNVSRTTYAALFALLNADGLIYGTGDGSTTFGLPDLRGRVVAGVDGGVNRLTGAQTGGCAGTLAAVGGEQGHTPTLAETFQHSHSHNHTSNPGVNFLLISGGSTPIGTGAGGYTQALTTSTDATAAGSSNAHNNVQPTLVLNYMISTGGP